MEEIVNFSKPYVPIYDVPMTANQHLQQMLIKKQRKRMKEIIILEDKFKKQQVIDVVRERAKIQENMRISTNKELKSERAKQRHTQSFQNFYDVNGSNFGFGGQTGKSEKQFHYDNILRNAQRISSERRSKILLNQEELDRKVEEYEKNKIKQHMKRLRQKEMSMNIINRAIDKK